MSWAGHLDIRYRRDGDAVRAHDRHDGPLRVLKALYPEGPGVCHHTLVHPPGGVAGGDTLAVRLHLEPGAHALLTTPGATRFYATRGPWAEQSVHAHLAPGARLEWLPLENIAHDACQVRNAQHFHLEPGAEMIGWDVTALGLPASGEPWRRGRFEQTVHLPDVWLEQARIDAADTLLLDSPLGWAGRRVLATAWWSSGDAPPSARVGELLDVAREAIRTHGGGGVAGVTSPHPRAVVLRVLGERVEPLMGLLHAVRDRWRQSAWQMAPCAPRVWNT